MLSSELTNTFFPRDYTQRYNSCSRSPCYLIICRVFFFFQQHKLLCVNRPSSRQPAPMAMVSCTPCPCSDGVQSSRTRRESSWCRHSPSWCRTRRAGVIGRTDSASRPVVESVDSRVSLQTDPL